MSMVQFCWGCITTAFQGLIGFVLIVLLLWGVIKLFRPGSKFPKPVIYRSQMTNASNRRDK